MKTYILTGGASTRFGENKLLAEVNGKAMLSSVIDKVNRISESVVLCGKPELMSGFGLIALADSEGLNGPLKGIASALGDEYAGDRFLLAGDMPYITADGLEFYLSHTRLTPNTILIPETQDGNHHYLHIFIPESLVSFARDAMSDPAPFSVKTWLSRLPTETLQIPAVFSAHFRNVNFREDLDEG
ncbi:MAG: molybdenum cofactor guanylyltransferase [Bacteroidetes bacterium]|nr:molybdenum cofactor guanylyltransferase [Bacteroidota bacterium]